MKYHSCTFDSHHADSFRQVDDKFNLVGYTHWDEKWIKNEYKTNGFQIIDPLNSTDNDDEGEFVEVDVDSH